MGSGVCLQSRRGTPGQGEQRPASPGPGDGGSFWKLRVPLPSFSGLQNAVCCSRAQLEAVRIWLWLPIRVSTRWHLWLLLTCCKLMVAHPWGFRTSGVSSLIPATRGCSSSPGELCGASGWVSTGSTEAALSHWFPESSEPAAVLLEIRTLVLCVCCGGRQAAVQALDQVTSCREGLRLESASCSGLLGLGGSFPFLEMANSANCCDVQCPSCARCRAVCLTRVIVFHIYIIVYRVVAFFIFI